jgi:hypothetical protein
MYKKLTGTDFNQKVSIKTRFGNWYLLGQVCYKSLNAFEVDTPKVTVDYPSSLCF